MDHVQPYQSLATSVSFRSQFILTITDFFVLLAFFEELKCYKDLCTKQRLKDVQKDTQLTDS